MNEKKEKQDKRPIDMNTDEAIEYVFGSELAEELRRQAGKCDPPQSDEPDSDS